MVQPDAEGPDVTAVKAPSPAPPHSRAIFSLTCPFAGIVPARQELLIDEGIRPRPGIGQRHGQEALDGRAGLTVVELLAKAHPAGVGKLSAEGGVDIVERVVRANKHPGQRVDGKGQRGAADLIALFANGHPNVTLTRGRGGRNTRNTRNSPSKRSRPADYPTSPHH